MINHVEYKCKECGEKAICVVNGDGYCEKHSVTHRNVPGTRIKYLGQAKRKMPKKP